MLSVTYGYARVKSLDHTAEPEGPGRDLSPALLGVPGMLCILEVKVLCRP